MRPNPYQIRNAIRDPRYFFGRRRELGELTALVGADQPQSVAVIGDRRIGKSSLLQALYRQCRACDNTIVAYQDVNGLNSSDEVLAALVDNLSLVGHASVPVGPSLHSTLRRLISELTKQRSRVVLLLDEFDTLTRNTAFPITFFNFLRSLANEFPVALVLTAAKKLKDICHSEEVAGSPFFNIFHERRLGCFTREEAFELIEVPSTEAGTPLHGRAEQVIQYVGRWPFFLQIMCYWLCELGTERLRDPEGMKAAHAHAGDDITVHLRHLWRQLSILERRACRSVHERISIGDVPSGVLDSLMSRGLLEPAGRDGYRLAFELLGTFLSLGEASPCASGAAPTHNEPVRVFVSYCHRDWRIVERLGIIDFLRDLESEGFEVFSDHQLQTGDAWNEVLSGRLREARILVALVTPDYLRSRYCQEVEIKSFWEGRVKDGLVVFPIIISPCEWDRHQWLRATQFLPRKGTVMDFKGARRQALLVEALRQLRTLGQRMSSIATARI